MVSLALLDALAGNMSLGVGDGTCSSAASRRARHLQRSTLRVATRSALLPRRLDADDGDAEAEIAILLTAMAHQSLNQASATSAGSLATTLHETISARASDGSLGSAITAYATAANVTTLLTAIVSHAAMTTLAPSAAPSQSAAPSAVPAPVPTPMPTDIGCTDGSQNGDETGKFARITSDEQSTT